MAAAPASDADAAAGADAALLDFAAVMRRLQAECPWKRAQTHRSLARYLLEESHEAIEAIETGGPADLREELGDLLLQVYVHAVMAEEAGEFTLGEVAAGVAAKMRRRNPHVFAPESPDGADGAGGAGGSGGAGGVGGSGGAGGLDPAAVNEVYERAKAAEKRRADPMAGLPASLPALLWADKVVDRLQRAGTAVGPGPEGAASDLGEQLLALVVRARAEGVDAEQALRTAVRRRLPADPSDAGRPGDPADPVRGTIQAARALEGVVSRPMPQLRPS